MPKVQEVRMTKQSALRRQANRELPALLVENRRKGYAADLRSKAKREPREVQRAKNLAAKDKLGKVMAERRKAIAKQLETVPVIEPVPIEVNTENPPGPRSGA